MDYSVINILVSIVLGLIMFGVGLSITIEQVKAIYQYPKAFLVAITSQMIALPIIAFNIAELSDIPATVKVGLVILASSPGGATSGFITYLFKGNTALSITLTSINSFLCLLSIPFIVNIALSRYMTEGEQFYLPFWHTFYEIFMVTILPATLGILLRKYKPQLAIQFSKYSKPVLMTMLAIVFIIKIFGSEKHGETGLSVSEITTLLPYCLLLNVVCLLVGYFLPKAFSLGYQNQITTAVESGVHNTTLAFLVAGTLLNNPELAKPALVYAMISFWTALIFGFITYWIEFKKTLFGMKVI